MSLPHLEHQLRSAVATTLSGVGAKFSEGTSLHGVETDFLVTPSKDRQVVLEVKDWAPTPNNIKRAAAQARLIKEAGNVTEAYIVLPKLDSSSKEPGVITLADISGVLGKISFPHVEMPENVFSIVIPSYSEPKRSVFVAMPFDITFEDVFYLAAAYAAEQAKAVVKRTDKEPFEGDVVSEIHSCIRKSVAVIADLSEARPNVMYEVGYAHALERVVIPICRTPLNQLPFDVRNWNVLAYSVGNICALREPLAERLKAAIG